MKIDIVNTALPPQFDAIGHYTRLFSQELARFADVRLLLPTGRDYDPIDQVALAPCFSLDTPDGIRGLIEPVCANPPDWLLLQYNPFGYGKRGHAPHLVPTLRELKRRCPSLKLAVMAHENFVPCWGDLRFMAMATWQVPQFWQLGHTADIFFVSIQPWADHARGWFRQIPVHWLPVGSNIPPVAVSRESARDRLGIADETLAVGLFGTAHVSRLLPLVAATLSEVRKTGIDARLLYIGPDGAAIREALGTLEPICAEGPLPFDEVSQRFVAMDVYLAPFSDGVSARRGSLMTGLDHGIASVGTSGKHTDTLFRESDEKAILLAPVGDEAGFQQRLLRLLREPELRQRIGQGGKQLYDQHFDWPPLVQKLLHALEARP